MHDQSFDRINGRTLAAVPAICERKRLIWSSRVRRISARSNVRRCYTRRPILLSSSAARS
nr:MAG TPA: hypothetical protein [Caudoviricetes sp.]